MGRYNLSAVKVHAHATQLLKGKKLASAPPWYGTIGSIPSSEVLTRKPMYPRTKGSKKASRLFSPVQLEQKEDKLRWEFFNDHPWELARPRVVVEQDGRDAEKWDWSISLCRPRYKAGDEQSRAEVDAWERAQKEQGCRPINGEAVIQRQQWLMEKGGLSQAAAYDKARKEFYAVRHQQEIEQRVAKEEAVWQGAIFGQTALERGMEREDKAYEHWRTWAAREVALIRSVQSGGYTGEQTSQDEEPEQELDELLDSIPGSNAGQTALGGAAVHP